MVYQKKTSAHATRPPKLQSNDTIGIVAPASHFNPDTFTRGIKTIQAMGFQVLIEDQVFQHHRYFAGKDEQRAQHLNMMFENRDVNAIICARGGYGAMRILPFLNYEMISEHPKPFVGFSDISALLATLYQKCGMVVFHGPTVTTLGKNDRETANCLKQVLYGNDPDRLDAQNGRVIHKGMASGPVLCANLTTLSHLMGTPFFPDLDGHILVIEDIGEKPYRIDRMLAQLKLSGKLNKIRGLALGNFSNCGPGDEIHMLFKEITKDMDMPVLTGFQLGHQGLNQTVPVGVHGILDTEKKQLLFSESSGGSPE